MRFLLLFLAASSFAAQNVEAFGRSGKGGSGAQFLKIAPGSRPAGLAEAYGGLAEGIYAAHYNPAGLGFLTGFEAAASREQRFAGVGHNWGGVGFPLLSWTDSSRKRGEWGTAALWASSLSIADIERRGLTETDADQGRFEAADTALAVSYGIAFGRAAAGGTVKWIEQRIDSVRGSGAAVDFGGLVRAERAGFGAGVRNLGSGIRLGSQSDPLPTVLYAGAMTRPWDGWLAVVELRQPVDDSLLLSIGAEHERRFTKSYSGAFQTGWNSANLDAGGLGGVSVGGEIRSKGFSAGFAWAPMGELGSTYRYSVVMRF